MWQAIVRSNVVIKLKSWEYWPFGIVQFPAILYYFWLSLRARSFIFFSASNPGIPMGGMFGESKFNILEKIPSQYKPITRLVTVPSTTEQVLKILQESNLQFPVIFKPDLGERGFMVRRINNQDEIDAYLATVNVNFIVQELVDFPLEFGVFYTRFPTQEYGQVTSVTMKEMLFVTGDGKSTLRELILRKDRAKLQWSKLEEIHRTNLDAIISPDERIELVSIGNHCLGTKFIDANHLIDERLSKSIDGISKNIPGFYIGRFDLRCESIEHLYDGRVKIMELNGCGAEPAHVYHPGFSFFKAAQTFCEHWRNIFQIARENKRLGARYTTTLEAYRYYKMFKASQGKA